MASPKASLDGCLGTTGVTVEFNYYLWLLGSLVLSADSNDPKAQSPFPSPVPQNSTGQLNPGPPLQGRTFDDVLWNSSLRRPPPPPWWHDGWGGCHLCRVCLGLGHMQQASSPYFPVFRSQGAAAACIPGYQVSPCPPPPPAPRELKENVI